MGAGKAVDHCFGGEHTQVKLDILGKYLNFYTKALKRKFTLLYVDAFAGSGSRTEKIPESLLLGEEKQKRIYDGSAKISLDTTPPFDGYLFIELKKKRYEELLKLKAKHPDKHVTVKKGDANEEVQKLCNKTDWSKNKYRGVIFIDPYGNNVDWKTLEAIAATQCFDVWFLFPISGVYRQIAHDQDKLDDYKKENLNRLFGTNKWESTFYEKKQQTDMFGTHETTRRVHYEEMEGWVKSRLSECFFHVTDPLPLPQTGPQLFSLFFLVSNPSGQAAGLANKVAKHLLNKYM